MQGTMVKFEKEREVKYCGFHFKNVAPSGKTEPC